MPRPYGENAQKPSQFADGKSQFGSRKQNIGPKLVRILLILISSSIIKDMFLKCKEAL